MSDGMSTWAGARGSIRPKGPSSELKCRAQPSTSLAPAGGRTYLPKYIHWLSSGRLA